MPATQDKKTDKLRIDELGYGIAILAEYILDLIEGQSSYTEYCCMEESGGFRIKW